MADPVFHDGMQDYNDKLNIMRAQIDAGAYASPLAISVGGTGATTAAAARAALGVDTALALKLDKTGGVVGQLTVQSSGAPVLSLNALDSSGIKLRFSDNGVSRGYIAADSTYPFRVVNAGNSAYILSVNGGGALECQGITTSGSLSTFNTRLLSDSAGAFAPSSSAWVNPAVACRGSYGGGLSFIDVGASNNGGTIWVQGPELYFATAYASGAPNQAVKLNSTSLAPNNDAQLNLGNSAQRWAQVYAASSSISTSDARLKTDVRPMAEAELAAAKQLGQEIGFYQFLSAVAAKGDALARLHAGMTVQHAIAIMESHGLDAMAYGFICYDEWAETSYEHPEQRDPDVEHPAVWQPAVEHLAEIDEDGETVLREAYTEPAVLLSEARIETGALIAAAWTETKPAGNIYSFRYDELNQFILAGMHARQVAIEARLAALESAP